MQSSFNVLLYSFYSMASIWNGPIGDTARFFCFDGDTNIKMADHKYKKIKDIQVGDETMGGKVLSTYKLKANPEDMYRIATVYKSPTSENNKLKQLKKRGRSVIVSGTHLIYEDGQWICVKDSKKSLPYSEVIGKPYNKQFIYSLRTSDSIIYTDIRDVIFRDYDQINDYDINKNILDIQIYFLNNSNNSNNLDYYAKNFRQYISNNKQDINKSNNFRPMFDANVKVTMKDGENKLMKDMKIGDEVLDGGKVLGVVKGLIENSPVYNFNFMNMTRTGMNIKCSQGAVVYNLRTNKWHQVCRDEFAEKDEEYSNEIMYSLLTENGYFPIEFINFRDHDVNHECDPLVEDYMKKIITNNPIY